MNTKKTCFPRKIGSMSRKVSLLTLLAFALLLSPMVAYGATVTLAWNANTETDLKGYRIYYGSTVSGDYSEIIDIADKKNSLGWSSGCGPEYDPFKTECCEYTLEVREEGETYYLAATAYDQDNNESAYSVELVHSTGNPNKPKKTIEAEDMPIKTGVATSGGMNIWGYIADNMDFAAGGTVSFEVTAKGDYAGGAWPIMEVRIDQTPVGTITVNSSSWAAYTIQANITPGTHEVAFAFINDYWVDPDDRNLYIDKVTITVAGDNLPPEASIIADDNGIAPLLVNFDGSGSHDPDGEIISYDWDFGDGTIDSGDTVSHTFSDPGVTVTLTVTDDQGATGSDTIQITANPTGSHSTKNSPPAANAGSSDPDGDGDSNGNADNLETDPDYSEGNFAPNPPQPLNPGNGEKVGLTPLLETDEFYDPNIDDVHSQTQWKIIRVHDDDEVCVFDVTTTSSLTVLKVPKLILEEGIDYIWQVKFMDNQGTASEWSEAGYFTTDFLEQDSDGNGVLDPQEVDTTVDLDNDGNMDWDQEDIKCVATETGDFKIGISIRESENADSIVSIQSETPSDTDLLLSDQDGLNFLAFGLIHFKLLVKEPGDEVLVTIYLSKAAYDDGIWYKYDPVNDEWFDYSDFIDFSADRKTVHLTLTDGGFGDADGIENRVIVDPLALRTATDHSSGSDFFVEDIAEKLDPSGMCFISAADSRSADRQPLSLWREIRNRELLIVFILAMLAYIGKEIFLRIKQYRRPGRRTSLMEGWRNS